MPGSDDLDKDVADLTEKQLRKQFPSGWMKLARYETNILVIDTLLQELPNREFTVSELADHSGASSRSIGDHIEDLVELGIVQQLPGRKNVRYQLNQQNPIVKDLYNLNNTVERVSNGDLEQSKPTLYETESKNKGDNVIGIRTTVPTGKGMTPVDNRAL